MKKVLSEDSARRAFQKIDTKDQEKRKFISNPGYVAIHTGEVSGTIVGGYIDSFNILQGTDYIPSIRNAVLFLEDNYPTTADILDWHIHSLILQKDFQYVKGIVLGRFQVDSKITVNLFAKNS